MWKSITRLFSFNKLDPLPKLITPYLGTIAIGILYLILSNLFYISIPQVLRIGMNSLEQETATAPFLFYCFLAVVGLAVIGGFFMYLTRQTIIIASRDVEYDLRNYMFAHLLRLPLSFYDRASTGDMMNRLTNDLEGVRRILGPAIMYMSRNIIRVSFAIICMIMISPLLTLYATVPFLLLSMLIQRVNHQLQQYAKEVQEQRSDLTTRAQQNFAGIRLLKVFGREQYEINDFRQQSDTYRNISLQKAKYVGFLRSIAGIIGEVGLAITLAVGGMWLMHENLSRGSFLAFTAYQFLLAFPVLSIPRVLSMLQDGLSSLKRLQDILDTKPEIPPFRSDDELDTDFTHSDIFARNQPEQENAKSSWNPDQHHISIRHLTFSYPYTEETVLDDVSLEIPEGITLGIAGPTGAGKSTLVQLLLRLYPVPENTIFWGDRDIQKIPRQSLRSRMSMVPQGNFLFSTKLNKNIAYAREQWEQQEVKNAAKLSSVHRDIQEFPDGYEQMIGERGVNLSGGQKQRTSKSRALMLDAPVIIMDDSFSNVDNQTGKQIMENISNQLSDQTWILITHNQNLLKRTDRIAVLKEGRLVQEGSHAELIESSGTYQNLFLRK